MKEHQATSQELFAELARLRERVAFLEESQKAMQESEERSRRLVDMVPQLMGWTDANRGIVQCNQRWHEYTGQTPAESRGFGWMNALHPDDVARVRQRIEETRASQSLYEAEYRVRRASDGVYRWHLARSVPMKDKDGGIIGWLGCITDIDDRKMAEAALRASEQRFRKVFEEGPIGILLVDVTGRVQRSNRLFCEMLGYSEDEIIALGPRGISHPDDWTRDYPIAARLWRGELRSYRLERRYIRKDGRVITGRLMVSLMLDAEKRPTGSIGMVEDITEQKRAEESLRLSEVKYRRLHQSLMDAYVSVGMDGRIQDFNDCYRTMLGFEAEELLGRHYTEITPEKWHRSEADILENQVLRNGYSDAFEKEYRRKDGTIFPVEFRAFLIRDNEGQPASMWAIVRDITDRKRAEESLQRAHHELEQRLEDIRLNEARLEAVLQLGHMTESPLKEITDFALEQAVALTQSKIGYLAFMNDEETVLTIHSWSMGAMAACDIENGPRAFQVATAGLWGEAARRRKVIVVNDYATSNLRKKGTPEGHVPLFRHMHVPIFDGGRIVIVAGVGNKDRDYDESDIRQMTLLMEGTWTLMQRRRVQQELHRHQDDLEQLVRERTEELRQSRDELLTIYDQITDGIAVVDAEKIRIVHANSGFYRMVGYSQEDIGSLSVERLHPPEFCRTALDHFEAVQKGATTWADNVPFVRKDGGLVYADVVTSPICYNKRNCWISFFHDVTERKRAEESLQRDHRTLKHLLQSSDHERQLIAYEIHDELAQQLAGAIMQFQAYAHQKQQQPEVAEKAFDAGMAMLRMGHNETRRLIAGVRPPILDEEGVVPAIIHLVNEEERQRGPKIAFRSKVGFDRLSPILENAIYRIVQEGLTNACKHSRSNAVKVSLSQRGDNVRIKIQDWGIGFDTRAVQGKRFGLVGIRHRVRLLGGRCSIRSAAGRGTRIVAELPLVERG